MTYELKYAQGDTVYFWVYDYQVWMDLGVRIYKGIIKDIHIDQYPKWVFYNVETTECYPALAANHGDTKYVYQDKKSECALFDTKDACISDMIKFYERKITLIKEKF